MNPKNESSWETETTKFILTRLKYSISTKEDLKSYINSRIDELLASLINNREIRLTLDWRMYVPNDKEKPA